MALKILEKIKILIFSEKNKMLWKNYSLSGPYLHVQNVRKNKMRGLGFCSSQFVILWSVLGLVEPPTAPLVCVL